MGNGAYAMGLGAGGTGHRAWGMGTDIGYGFAHGTKGIGYGVLGMEYGVLHGYGVWGTCHAAWGNKGMVTGYDA